MVLGDTFLLKGFPETNKKNGRAVTKINDIGPGSLTANITINALPEFLMLDGKTIVIGDNTFLDPAVEICMEHEIGDGRGVFIGDNCVIYPRNRLVLGDLNANRDANIVLGNNVLINAGGYISGEGGLEIGNFVLIGPNVNILSAGHEFGDCDKPIQKQGLTYGKIKIEDDAWIGAGSVVLQGLTIGRGAVVGAGSVVTRNVPPYAIVIGNPARIVKYRNGQPHTESATEKDFWGKVSAFLSRRQEKIRK